MKLKVIVALLALAGLVTMAHQLGYLGGDGAKSLTARSDHSGAAKHLEQAAPSVSVARIATFDFIETVVVTGSLVPREEILVAPEVDGFKVLEVRADEGSVVKKDDILAILVFEQLDALLAQNDAAKARAEAAIARANSQIAEAEARQKEAKANLERARPLVRDKYLSESTFDQRQATSSAATAQLLSAQSGRASAEAELAQVIAQRRELLWRRANTEVRAPADGLVSRRTARIGAIAQSGPGNSSDPLFRIISNGEIELDAEASEQRLAKLRIGQPVKVSVAGAAVVPGTVRLVSPEVDKTTRLGRIRVFLGKHPELRVGSFGRGVVETARAHNIAVAQSAILYGEAGASVQVVVDGIVSTRPIKTGLSAGDLVEVVSGLNIGDVIVTKAGTFLRDGDKIQPVMPEPALSEVAR